MDSILCHGHESTHTQMNLLDQRYAMHDIWASKQSQCDSNTKTTSREEGIADVLVLSATNHPDLIDPIFFRPGCFDLLLHVRPPNERTRMLVLQDELMNMTQQHHIQLEASLKAMHDGVSPLSNKNRTDR